MGHQFITILLLAIISACASACAASPAAPTHAPDITATAIPVAAPRNCKNVPNTLEQACTSESTGLPYWLYMPKETGSKPPLLIYLHGFSHSGSDLMPVLSEGVPAQLEQGRALPMVVISPQCPNGEIWPDSEMASRLSRFVEEMVATYGTDPDRTYLTGFSMGGDGVWATGAAYSHQFAALAPVASWYSDKESACALKDVPVWVFQSDQDEIVAPHFAKEIVSALQQCGGVVKLTLFTQGGHEASSRSAYATDALYSWLLAQQRSLNLR